MTLPIDAGSGSLVAIVFLHLATTLSHFAHNALRLRDYPGLPDDWTSLGVMLAWLPIALLGITGLVLLQARRPAARPVLATFAVLGFAGFGHYALAPFGSHTLVMHLAIFAEAMSGAALLVCLWLCLKGTVPGRPKA